MRVLVLGGSGFVSSLFVKKILQIKDISVDTLTRKGVTIDRIKNNYMCSRNNLNELKSLIHKNQYDYIFDFSSYNKEDVLGILKAIDIKYLKTYVYCSSIAVYKNNSDCLSETDFCDASYFEGQYAINKLNNERIIIQESFYNAFNYIIVRPSYIYGPGNPVHRENFYFLRAMQQKNIFLPQRDIKLQLVYIEDLVDFLFYLLSTEERNSAIYNYASRDAVGLHEMVNKIIDISKSKSKIIFYDELKTYKSIGALRLLPFHNKDINVSMDKVEREGFPLPQTKLVNGLQKSYDYIINNGLPSQNLLLYYVDGYYEKGIIVI